MSESKPSYPALDLDFEPTPAAHVAKNAEADAEADKAVQEPEPLAEEALRQLTQEEGLDPGLVYHISRLAVKSALASLHKEALTNERETYGLLHYCLKQYGAEACFHLCGILERSQLGEREIGWETLGRALPQREWEPFYRVAEGWLTERSETRIELDQSREDEVWQQELENLKSNPEVDRNGKTFLDSLLGRPTLAKALVQSRRLLEEVLGRQQAASTYTEHMVIDLHQDPDKSQWEAEREYLLLPDEASAPNLNLNNWDNR